MHHPMWLPLLFGLLSIPGIFMAAAPNQPEKSNCENLLSGTSAQKIVALGYSAQHTYPVLITVRNEGTQDRAMLAYPLSADPFENSSSSTAWLYLNESLVFGLSQSVALFGQSHMGIWAFSAGILYGYFSQGNALFWYPSLAAKVEPQTKAHTVNVDGDMSVHGFLSGGDVKSSSIYVIRIPAQEQKRAYLQTLTLDSKSDTAATPTAPASLPCVSFIQTRGPSWRTFSTGLYRPGAGSGELLGLQGTSDIVDQSMAHIFKGVKATCADGPLEPIQSRQNWSQVFTCTPFPGPKPSIVDEPQKDPKDTTDDNTNNPTDWLNVVQIIMCVIVVLLALTIFGIVIWDLHKKRQRRLAKLGSSSTSSASKAGAAVSSKAPGAAGGSKVAQSKTGQQSTTTGSAITSAVGSKAGSKVGSQVDGAPKKAQGKGAKSSISTTTSKSKTGSKTTTAAGSKTGSKTTPSAAGSKTGSKTTPSATGAKPVGSKTGAKAKA